MSADIESQVKEIIVEQLDVKPEDVAEAKPHRRISGPTRLAIVELVRPRGEVRGRDPRRRGGQIKTVGDAIAYIKTHVGK